MDPTNHQTKLCNIWCIPSLSQNGIYYESFRLFTFPPFKSKVQVIKDHLYSTILFSLHVFSSWSMCLGWVCAPDKSGRCSVTLCTRRVGDRSSLYSFCKLVVHVFIVSCRQFCSRWESGIMANTFACILFRCVKQVGSTMSPSLR